MGRARLNFHGPVAAIVACLCLASGDGAGQPQSAFHGPHPGAGHGSGRFGEATSEPLPSVALESAKYTIAPEQLALSAYAISEPALSEPVISVDDFGAKGDARSDDTDAINRAVRSLNRGGTVRFTPGKTYLKRGLLVVDRADIQLWGYGARLYSVVTDEEARVKGAARVGIQLLAPRTAVYGLTLTSNVRKRLTGHPNASGVHLASDEQQVIDARFEYAGIFARKARRFVIARNVVYRSTADGIHVTTGSSDGLVVGNLVRETGDDMIAVVNYGLGEPTVGNVLIERNDVSGQYWGRGIAIVGGRNITVRGNKIARTAFGAGILVHSETSYRTANVRGVRIEENDIREVQTLAPDYNPARRRRKAGHGAIDVNGQGAQQVSGVLIRKNTIQGTAKDGIYVRGNACDIDISGNDLNRIGRTPIHIDSETSLACRIACTANRLGRAVLSNPRCSAALLPGMSAGSVTLE
ncbi:MAG TPA: right-handed parallel beta-helix repeat-containing protein [Polyangiaceae bacterium]|nr:right-handed parallel beta-helix repeat-containing protein [Polyangiaceae bacterium]